jgi:hypothetical protein
MVISKNDSHTNQMYNIFNILKFARFTRSFNLKYIKKLNATAAKFIKLY